MKRIRFHLSLLALAAATIILPSPARADATEAPPVDAVTAGDASSEQAHHFKGEQTDTGQTNGRAFRFTGTNGWFSWELHVLPGAAQDLNVEFGGGRRAAPETTQILMDDTRLGSVRLTGGLHGEYYRLSPDTLKGKDTITVRFQAAPRSRVSGVYSVSVTKVPPPTIASMSKASSTRTNYQFIVNVINDQREPASSGDRVKKHFDWWPAKATNQWVQYDFAASARVSAVEVYWFDDFDIHVGDCVPPKSWRVLYRQNGEWKPVTGASAYGSEKDRYNRTTFDALETDGLRLDVEMPDTHSSGVLQWKVE